MNVWREDSTESSPGQKEMEGLVMNVQEVKKNRRQGWKGEEI
jgi:hypothetical protein